MSDDVVPNIMSILPREMLENILKFVPLTDLGKCREVCTQWNEIIKCDEFWRELCKRDFSAIYKEAKLKGLANLTWQKLYKTLNSWSRLNYHSQTRQVLISSDTEEFRRLKVIKHGTVAVHISGSVKYCDLARKKRTDGFSGNNKKYDENDNFIVLLQCMLHEDAAKCIVTYIRGGPKPCSARNCLLKIIPRVPNISKFENVTHANVTQIKNITDFLLVNNKVFYIQSEREIYSYTVDQGTTFLKKIGTDIIAMSYSKGCLNILTKDYTMLRQTDEKDFIPIIEEFNILHRLKTYNFFERFDEELWGLYYNWIRVPKSHSPQGPLTRINAIKAYGDIILLGTSYGILNVYYSPYTDGVLDLVYHKPAKVYDLKQYQIMSDGTFSASIRAIDIIETVTGHKIVVCLNRKVIVLTLIEIYKRNKSGRVPIDDSDDDEEKMRNYIMSDPTFHACFILKRTVD